MDPNYQHPTGSFRLIYRGDTYEVRASSQDCVILTNHLWDGNMMLDNNNWYYQWGRKFPGAGGG